MPDSRGAQPSGVIHAQRPPQPSMRVLNDIVGDSALQLNKSKGTVGFEAELKALLGPHVDIIRFPGEGAGAISST